MRFSTRLARFPSILVLAALLIETSVASFAKDASLNYLAPNHPDSALILAPPPLPGSDEQAADMQELVAVRKAFATNEANVAMSDSKFSIFSFTPAIGAFFQPGKFPKTEAFFERVQSDASAATDHAKNYWKRPRPYTLDPSLVSGKVEKTFSYPSGHSTESTVLALVLGELFPDKKEGILAISRGIGWHRVQLARHYPTDIYAGRVFARAIVSEFKANPAFRRDLEEACAELKAAMAKVETKEIQAIAQ